LKIVTLAVVVVVVLVIGVAAIYFAFVQTSGPTLCGSKWECAAGYPVEVGGTYAIAGQQCVNSTSTIYCIGGQDANGGPRNEVYYATVSSSGNITGWTQGSAYPQYSNGGSCVLYAGYVYCVGGSYNDNGDDVSSSYFAQVTAGGALETWSSTTPYPIPIDTMSCVQSSAYIYCVGGNNETDGSNLDSTVSNSVWFAPLSSSGIGAWEHTMAYPASVLYPTCYSGGGYIYCIGGADVNGNSVGTTYYAALSSSGVGEWTATTSYPVAASGQACVIASGEILCVGGETDSSPSYTSSVYYAPILSTGGIGSWKQGTSYPLAIGTTCVTLSGDVYCFGGFDGSSAMADNHVEYASMASLTG
jgi:hypothetical protein